jgi:mRNA-degrading endonuclease RelE of RelBE toxin-antitoxin system
LKKYILSYLPIFDADLVDTWEYIAYRLKNHAAADRLASDVEGAVLKRLESPESFEKYDSKKKREHPYYRIRIRNFTVWYVVIDNVMEVRRLLYNKRDIEDLL